jgi:hypothetical protein
LKLCFENNVRMISATLNSKSKEIDRTILLDAVKHVFHNTSMKGYLLTHSLLLTHSYLLTHLLTHLLTQTGDIQEPAAHHHEHEDE